MTKWQTCIHEASFGYHIGVQSSMNRANGVHVAVDCRASELAAVRISFF